MIPEFFRVKWAADHGLCPCYHQNRKSGDSLVREFSGLTGLDVDCLAALYSEEAHQHHVFYEYLADVFFVTHGARYFVLEEDGAYLSALRIEPFWDGLLLAGLQTHPHHRCRGYALALMGEVLEGLRGMKIYSHIEKKNPASRAIHEKLGFSRIRDCATLLDGTVTSRFDTYLLMDLDKMSNNGKKLPKNLVTY